MPTPPKKESGHFVHIDGRTVYIADRTVDAGEINKAAEKHGVSDAGRDVLHKAHAAGRIETDAHLYQTIAHAKEQIAKPENGGDEAVYRASVEKHGQGAPLKKADLQGSAKQVSWAGEIRDKHISDFKNNVDDHRANLLAKVKDGTLEKSKADETHAGNQASLRAMHGVKDADFWIDSRNSSANIVAGHATREAKKIREKHIEAFEGLVNGQAATLAGKVKAGTQTQQKADEINAANQRSLQAMRDMPHLDFWHEHKGSTQTPTAAAIDAAKAATRAAKRGFKSESATFSVNELQEAEDPEDDSLIAKAEPEEEPDVDKHTVSLFTADFSLSATGGVSEDGFVIKPGKLFQAGEYPDKNYSMTEEEIAAAAAAFTGEVPMNVEHAPSVFDGKLGSIRRVWQEGKELLADFAIPTWLNDLIGGEPLKVSPEWNRDTKRLTAAAWVINPRITDAALFAAFSESKGGKEGGHFVHIDGHAVYIADRAVGPKDIKKAADKHGVDRNGRWALNQAHKDGRIKTDRHLYHVIAHTKKQMAKDKSTSSLSAVERAVEKHGGKPGVPRPDHESLDAFVKALPESGAEHIDDISRRAGLTDTEVVRAATLAELGGKAVRHPKDHFGRPKSAFSSRTEGGGNGEAEMSLKKKIAAFTGKSEADVTDADIAKFKAEFGDVDELDRLKAKDRERDAEAFADEQIRAYRALPAEKPLLMAAFSQAVADDAASAPSTVTFSVEGKPVSGSLGDLLTAGFSTDGKPVEGTRVNLLRATLAARPGHDLTTEMIDADAVGKSPFAALFSKLTTENPGTQPKEPRPGETDEVLAATATGRRILASRNGNGK